MSDNDPITPAKLEAAGWVSGSLWSITDFPPMWGKSAWRYETNQGEALSYCELWAEEGGTVYLRLFDGMDEAINSLPVRTMTDLLTLCRLLSGSGA